LREDLHTGLLSSSLHYAFPVYQLSRKKGYV